VEGNCSKGASNNPEKKIHEDWRKKMLCYAFILLMVSLKPGLHWIMVRQWAFVIVFFFIISHWIMKHCLCYICNHKLQWNILQARHASNTICVIYIACRLNKQPCYILQQCYIVLNLNVVWMNKCNWCVENSITTILLSLVPWFGPLIRNQKV